MSIVRHEPGKILSGAVEYGNLVFVAGTTPDDLNLDVEGQTKQVLAKIDALLAKSGSHKSKILSANIWVTDIRNRDAMNKAWLAWADPKALPARACIEGKMAEPNCLVEIQIIAAKL